MCQICAAARMGDALARYDSHAGLTEASSAAARPGQLKEIAGYLTDGFWDANWESTRSFDVSQDNVIHYDMDRLEGPIRAIAKAAMQAWSDVSGLRFAEKDQGSGAVEIRFNDAGSQKAYTDFGRFFTGGSIYRAEINISKDWVSDEPISLNAYWFQTYMHEIGHALGLGHAGDYNGSDEIPRRTFEADSWQVSVMSYFSQQDTPRDDGDYAYLATVMPADILAVRQLYGLTPTTRAGDTVYGANSNVGGYLGRMFAAHFDFQQAGRFVDIDNPFAFTVFDTGGNDTLDFSTLRSNQRIDLSIFATSDVGGIRGSVLIGPDTVIENAIGGRGRDRIIGNDEGNRLSGRGADDRLWGRTGADTLDGGLGDDVLDGGRGQDTIRFFGGADVRIDLSRQDAQATGQGRDRLVAIENARTGGGGDRLNGSDAANRLDAGAGRDRLSGGAGDDTLLGGPGHDVMRGMGDGDLLLGQAGNDTLTGGGGADRLRGDAGSDRLNGEGGNDMLTGGAGLDTFVFTGGRDLIADFAVGFDRIVLNSDLWDSEKLSVEEVLKRFTDPTRGDFALDFGTGDRLTFAGLDTSDSLEAAITFL